MSRHSPTERIILTCRAWHRAARLLRTRCQRLQAEVSRLDSVWGETISQRDHWQWEAQRRIYARQELADLLGTEDIEEAVGTVRRLRTWAARWKAVAHRHRSRVRGLTMRFVSNLTGRVRAEREVARLQAALDSANERCNRIQADGNRLADQLHAWRQACQDHGVEPTPEALRAVLRRVDAECVAGADL